MATEENAATFLVLEMDVSPFVGLIATPLEPLEPPSFYFSLVEVQEVITTMVLNLMAVTEVWDMVKLVKKAFQCLGTFNLEL